MRILLTIVLALMAAACGRPTSEVYSRRPLLVGEGPRLRPGLWRSSSEACVFDETKPAGAWPDCVLVVVVRKDEILTGATTAAVLREGYVLADGLPMLLQVEVRPASQPPEQLYFGLRPILEGGEVIEFRRWPVTCTPPRKADRETDNTIPRPGPSSIAGVMVDDGGRCLIRTRDQLRAATVASEGWTADREHLKWVRSAEQ